MPSFSRYVLIFLVIVAFAYVKESKAASLSADACERSSNSQTLPAWCDNSIPTIIEIETMETAECGIFFGYMTECLNGNLLRQDEDGDGEFELGWYIISGTESGDDGLCPAKTSFSGAEIQDYIESEPAFYDWLIEAGFGDYDDFCAVD